MDSIRTPPPPSLRLFLLFSSRRYRERRRARNTRGVVEPSLDPTPTRRTRAVARRDPNPSRASALATERGLFTSGRRGCARRRTASSPGFASCTRPAGRSTPPRGCRRAVPRGWHHRRRRGLRRALVGGVFTDGGRASGAVHARDVVDGAPALVFFVERVEADEVLLRVARHLRGRAAHHEVARDGAPVALAELGEPEKKQTVLLLGPRDALAALLVGRLSPRAPSRNPSWCSARAAGALRFEGLEGGAAAGAAGRRPRGLSLW